MQIPVNKVIKIMVSTDFAFNAAFGSFMPVFALFLTDNIQGGTAATAGFATGTYWLVKSLLQLPVAWFLDKTDGEKDDFYALFIGYIVSSLTIFLYLFAKTPLHVYLIQALLGMSMAIAVPAWYAIFTRHIDKGKTSFEWSLDSVFAVGLATAAAGAIGGLVVTHFGFNALFIGAGIIGFLGSLSLIFLRPHIISAKITPSEKEHLLAHLTRKKINHFK